MQFFTHVNHVMIVLSSYKYQKEKHRANVTITELLIET